MFVGTGKMETSVKYGKNCIEHNFPDFMENSKTRVILFGVLGVSPSKMVFCNTKCVSCYYINQLLFYPLSFELHEKWPS